VLGGASEAAPRNANSWLLRSAQPQLPNRPISVFG
jgi:hypothetical protein